jgi:uncharacterized membrane protein
MLTTFNYGSLFNGILNMGLTFADLIIIICALALVCFIGVVTQKKDVREIMYQKPLVSALCAVLIFVAIMLFGAYGINYDATQFIYNQF